MKTRFKVLLWLLLWSLPDAVQAQFTYTTNNGTITITKFTGSGGEVTIPDAIIVDGVRLPVTSIGVDAFAACTGLTSVTIPDSVSSIGGEAFFCCTRLTSITIPNSVTNIEEETFYGCTSLTNITIPNTVTSIGGAAFYDCWSLASITIPNSATRIGDEAFFDCTRLTSLTIPNGVASIGASVLAYCTNLTSVTISTNVTTIGEGAFNYCTRLTSITIPDGVTSIGEAAFSLCISLTSVTIPKRVTRIGDYAFNFCTGLTSVYFKGDAPALVFNPLDAFDGDYNATVYYLAGTTGWGPTFGGLPAVLWNPQVKTSSDSFGVRSNRFGFTIVGSSNLDIVVEACTNLANPSWSPVGTDTLVSGSSYFSDPQWANYPTRFYRLRSP